MLFLSWSSFGQAQDGEKTDVGFLRLVMIKSAFVQAEGEKKINEPINRLAEKACQNTNHSEGCEALFIGTLQTIFFNQIVQDLSVDLNKDPEYIFFVSRTT